MQLSLLRKPSVSPAMTCEGPIGQVFMPSFRKQAMTFAIDVEIH